MRKWTIAVLGLVLLLGLGFPALGEEKALTISDREIVERLVRLEVGQENIRRELGGRIDALGGRIDALGGRIDDLRGLMYVVLGAILALIGFVIWDRRSAISPVITRTRLLEEDRDRTLRLLRDYAQREPKLADVMKSLGLM